MDNAIDITATMKRFKEDTKMDSVQWKRFCKRYFGRNVSSIAYYLGCLYGTMPKNINSLIQEELGRILKNA